MTGPALRIHTIGYQGADPARFVATLRSAGVRTLVDVRAVPWSRRPEFTRQSLADAMAAAGLGYRHMGVLGNPEQGRQAARSGRSYREIYEAHLDTPAAREALAELAAQAEGACLMCMERDPAQCHRSLLAERLERDYAIAVEHLAVGAAQLSLF